MQEISFNFPTIAILVVIAALAVLSIRRMTRRGLCDCGDHCGDGEGGCAGCSHCASTAGAPMPAEELPPCCQAAQRMADAAERSAAAEEERNR